MFCAISRESCQHPVVSKLSGHIFDKDLIEKHIKIYHKCPITDEPMEISDLISINAYEEPNPPRPSSATSIPSLLKTFQNEWDSLMLESYNLKKHCQELRQQLSHSLYQKDAACRVIVRLTQERDHALQELANTKENMATALATVSAMNALQNNSKFEDIDEDIDMDKNQSSSKSNTNEIQMDVEIIEEKIEEKRAMVEEKVFDKMCPELAQILASNASNLAKDKKAFLKNLANYVPNIETLSNYKLCHSYNAHSPSDPGITCLDIQRIYENVADNKIISGGYDCTLIVYDQKTKQFEQILKGHKKRINDVKFHSSPSIIVSAANECLVWKLNEQKKWEIGWNVNEFHSVIGVSMHPMKEYFCSASVDGQICLHSFCNQSTLTTFPSSKMNVKFTCMEVHPDGQLIGTGSASAIVQMWDLRSGLECITLDGDMHNKSINCLSFNPNGYYMATADADDIVQIWDLRKCGKKENKTGKQKKRFYSLTNDEYQLGKVLCLNFDGSGQYLVVGQPNGFDLFLSRKWKRFAQIYEHKRDVTGVLFSKFGECIVSASKDQTVKIYGLNGS